MKATAEHPMYLEYDKPVGRPRRYCCYKDSPCPTHAAAFRALVGAALDAPGDCIEKLEALSSHAPSADAAPAMSAKLGPLQDSEEDPARLWAEIHMLRADVQGPDGFETWKEAAATERSRRLKLQVVGQKLVDAYRQRFKKRSTSGIRSGAPLHQEFADFDAALSD